MAEIIPVISKAESSAVVVSNPFETNSNLRLSSSLLNEFNYLPWSRTVSLALGGRSKLGFINKDTVVPNDKSLEYETWLATDQMVRSWLLNSMEIHLAEIFSYADSAADMWEAIKEMYGNQNNAARVFQLQRDIACLHQEGKSFVQFLGNLKSMWNELAVYRPHTTDSATLLKRAEEDKIFQLLANLAPEYEDLRSRILMNHELPSLASVCSTIQREEVRRKVMNVNIKSDLSETRAYVAHVRQTEEKGYKGRRPDLKCTHCNNSGHTKDRCWVLHPELKPRFSKDNKGTPRRSQSSGYKANHVTTSTSDELSRFTSSPVTLINEFASYLQAKQGAQEKNEPEKSQSYALLGKFAGFLAENKSVSTKDISGSYHQEDDW
ncbi:uncharacterized protein LOC120002485 [Tripterygium wilfordii]|uniref:uncharacterized protein LOC120002485 n=1 Tax=Tripterygium wilfordii TaxID=458696 RepID=UPI0018F84707|nr:uncharacterized protein LOC120002485 [Tripterygium wilfordii]